jgi:ABC-type phosphate transport system auxiliary subunit
MRKGVNTEFIRVDQMNKNIVENVNECDDLLKQINVLNKKSIEHIERVKRTEKNKRIENDIGNNTNIPSLENLSRLESDKRNWEEEYPSTEYSYVHDVINEKVGKGGRSTRKGRRTNRKSKRTTRKNNTKR